MVLVVAEGRPGVSRLGLVVSRRGGNAVTRNRVKRRLRHAARNLPFQPGVDYVLIANGQVARVPYGQLLGWLRRALEEAERD